MRHTGALLLVLTATLLHSTPASAVRLFRRASPFAAKGRTPLARTPSALPSGATLVARPGPPSVTVRPGVKVLDRSTHEGVAVMGAIRESIEAVLQPLGPRKAWSENTYPVAEALSTPGRFQVAVGRGQGPGWHRYEIHTVEVTMNGKDARPTARVVESLPHDSSRTERAVARLVDLRLLAR